MSPPGSIGPDGAFGRIENPVGVDQALEAGSKATVSRTDHRLGVMP